MPVRHLLIALLLTGCAAQTVRHAADDPGFREANALLAEGRIEEGLARMEEVAAAHPNNVDYRNYLYRQREWQVAKILDEGDRHWQQYKLGEAEKSYWRVLELSSQNQRALEGLQRIETARKHESVLSRASEEVGKGETENAMQLVRAVLAENPSDAIARALYERIEQQRVAKLTANPKLDAAFRKTVTLEFKDVPLRSVFEFIARAADINFIYDKELPQQQQVSIFVRDSSIEEALELIMTTNQLRRKILNENTVLIYPASRADEYQESFVRSFYLGNTDAKRMLALIKTVVKTQDVYIDERLNTVVMRDTPEAIRIAEKLIASQDIPDPEVMLEVEVMEISRRTLEDIGIRYPTQVAVGVQGNKLTDDDIPVPGELTFRELENFNSSMAVFRITDPVLAFNLLHQAADSDLLANPHIRVKNREKAKIHIGDKIPVITSTTNSTGFVSESITYLETGIKLNVEPTVQLQNEVSIKVELEVSSPTERIVTDSGTVAYTLGSRNANTTLRLKDGETQVLAGLFRDDRQDIDSKVPGLADLPLIGRLFTNKDSDRTKREIVLLITPRILSNIVPPDATYTIFPAGVESARKSAPARGGRQAQYMPAPITQDAISTPRDIQAEQAQSDKSFADSILRPGVVMP